MKVYLIYNVVLVSAVQQTDSLIHICILFFAFFSIMFYHRILNRAPCACSRILLFTHFIYDSLHLLTLNSNPSLTPFSLLLGNCMSILYVGQDSFMWCIDFSLQKHNMRCDDEVLL